MTFEKRTQPQEKLEMNEVQEYYAVKNNSCHTFTIETYNGGETWIVSATGEEFKEAWLAEASLENMLMDRGYQVFYSIEEAEDFIREMDREDSPGCDLPQTEETIEQRSETPEEKELLNTVERLILSPDECVYYNGTNYSFRKRSWQDVCLVAHYEDNYPSRVMDLGQWVRHDALDAIRSLHERLQSV